MSPRPPLLFTPHSPFLLPCPVPTPQRLHHHHRLKPSSLCAAAAAAAASTRPQRQRRRLASPLAVSGGGGGDDFFTVDHDPDYDDGFDEELGSPWEGAVVYRRDAAVHHVEYGTSLERLGLGELSSPESLARAAAMGIRGRKAAALGEGEETPVLVSVDVARRRGRLRIDGIVRTVITLGCYRCAEPAPEGVFANFSLLLTEDPVEEPDVVDLGTIYEEDRTKAPLSASSKDDDDDIDWDDRLHFPAGAMEIDISKHIRDIIHLEITLDAFCSSSCKGLCLVCGTNLNTSRCNCSKETTRTSDVRRSRPLKDLLKPTQKR